MSGLTYSSNYAGDISEKLYLVIGQGWEKFSTYIDIETGVAKSKFLPAMSYTSGLQDYTAGVPSTAGTAHDA